MENVKLEYYVLNYDINRKKVINFNIFQNWALNDAVVKEVRKYIRAPKNYRYDDYLKKETFYGFEALCKEVQSLIMWQEWGRREYEISVGDAFEDNLEEFEKWDCYMQCKPNIEIIAREVIWQYKQQDKKEKNDVKR